jgi:tyrosinase
MNYYFSQSLRMLCVAGMCAMLLFMSSCKEIDPVDPDDVTRVRKNAKDLSTYEKWSYTNAIQQLKASPSPYSDTLTYCDSFVRMHQMAVEESKRQKCAANSTPGNYGVAHTNPAFPPWHRKLLITYEDALREVSGRPVTLPFWDWTDPASTAATFSSELMGGSGDPNQEYAVVDGPFRKDVFQVNLKTIIPGYQGTNDYNYLVRNFAAVIDLPGFRQPGYPVALPTASQVRYVDSLTVYDLPPFNASSDPKVSFRAYLEGFTTNGGQAMHNIGHDWIAGFFQVQVDVVDSTLYRYLCDSAYARNDLRVGSMEPLDVSPNDPAFFMHHANVDRIWYEWQQIGDNMDKYTNSGAPYQDLTADMYPFLEFTSVPQMAKHGIRPIDMMNSLEQINVIYEKAQ